MKHENWDKEDFGNGKSNTANEIDTINMNYRKRTLNIQNRT